MSQYQEDDLIEYEQYLQRLVMKAKLRRKVSVNVYNIFGKDLHSIIMKYY